MIITKLRRFLGKHLYWLYLPIGVIYGYIKIHVNSFNNYTPWLSMDDVRNNQNSDTIFIMGSGSSINYYSEKQWGDIKKSDSLGFNFWLLHEFIPTFYMFELPEELKMRDDFLHNLQLVEKKYSKTLIFLKEGLNGKKSTKYIPSNIIKQIKVLFNPTIPVLRVSQLTKALSFMQKIIKKGDNKKLIVFNKRASLFSAVTFAKICGYKKIVLCGVDLNNTNYFYQENSKEILSRGFKVPDTGQSGNTHKTDSAEYGEVTISELLKALNQELLKPNNIKLYTGSKESALNSWLPYYWEVTNERT